MYRTAENNQLFTLLKLTRWQSVKFYFEDGQYLQEDGLQHSPKEIRRLVPKKRRTCGLNVYVEFVFVGP